MKITELLDMTLRQILDTYCIVYSAECDYIYRITTFEAIGEINKKYEIDDEPSFYTKGLLDFEVEAEITDETTDKEILTFEKLEIILDNLGLKEKTKGE